MQYVSSYQVDSRMQAEDKTLYGIKDEAERSILVLWNLVVVLASLIGDSLILIGNERTLSFIEDMPDLLFILRYQEQEYTVLSYYTQHVTIQIFCQDTMK